MKRRLYTYNELLAKCKDGQQMPPREMMNYKEVEYRCPLSEKCDAHANCFAAAAPVPLDDYAILNIKCRLLGGKKLPVYAHEARVKD